MQPNNVMDLFELTDLTELLDRTGSLLSDIGFPHSTLQWCPDPAPQSTMESNSLIIWDNLGSAFGDHAQLLSSEIVGAIAHGLATMRRDTLERQNWLVRQNGPFRLVADANGPDTLTEYEHQLAGKFGAADWVESFLCPVSRERDRVLFLITRTSDSVSDVADAAVRKTLLAFWYAYHCLYITSVTGEVPSQSEAPAQPLSSREIECLHWLAAGKTISESAIILGISERTLRFHVNNARERLGVATTTQAIVAATLKHGFHTSDARKSVYKNSRQA